MPPATEQPRKSKHDSQAAKNSTEHKKIRFLNMNPQQVQRGHKRVKQREYRKALLQSKPRRPPSKAAATKPTVEVAMLAEDVLEVVIPFLRVPPGNAATEHHLQRTPMLLL